MTNRVNYFILFCKFIVSLAKVNMLLTTKERYAVMAIVDLAQNIEQQRPAKMQEIAVRQEISLSYLEQIFNKLKNAKIIKAVKGPGGGYLLNGDAQDIYISEVIRAVVDPIKFTRCSANDSCMDHKAKCKTHILWCGLENLVVDYLANITIADICNGKLTKYAKT